MDSLLIDKGAQQHVVDNKDTELLEKIKTVDQMADEGKQLGKRILDMYDSEEFGEEFASHLKKQLKERKISPLPL